jgi:hypothetical protein
VCSRGQGAHVTCTPLLQGEARKLRQAEPQSSQAEQMDIKAKEVAKSQAEQNNTKPNPKGAGGTLDPAKLPNHTPLANTKLNTLATSPTQETKTQDEKAELNTMADPEDVPIARPVEAELNSEASPPTPPTKARPEKTEPNNVAAPPDDHPDIPIPIARPVEAELNNRVPPPLPPALTKPEKAELNNVAAPEYDQNHPIRPKFDIPIPTRTSPKPTQAKLNTFVHHNNGVTRDWFAHTQHIQPMTPKRKRSPERNHFDNPQLPKTPRMNPEPENQTQETKPKPNQRMKPNPHPDKNQKVFIKVESTFVLLTHTGLAKTSRTKPKKTKPKPEPTTAPSRTQNPEPTTAPSRTQNQETKPTTSHIVPSKSITTLAKVFQNNTPPPRRLLNKPKPKPKPKPDCEPNQTSKPPASTWKPSQENDTRNCLNQPKDLYKPVPQKHNLETSQKSTNPPPRNDKVRDPPVEKSPHAEKFVKTSPPPPRHSNTPNPAKT